MEFEEKKGYCTLCRSRCGTVNTVRGDMMLKVRPDTDHPTGNAMCMKGKAAPELVHSPNRILYPMRRTAPKGAADPGWRRISWDEALDETARNLDLFRRTSGPESVVFGVTTPSGTPMSDSIDWVERFVWSFGSPNICYATEICNWHKDVAHIFTFGCGMPTADYANADVIVLWGTNPANTWLAQADAIAKGRRRGARLIVVDPRPTALALEADLWLRVRPGTDGALAMAIAAAMLDSDAYDHAFVRDWSNAPYLVRRDNGRFLRERDLAPESASNRYAVWHRRRERVELVDAARTIGVPDADLTDAHAVRVRDAAGRTVEVMCDPAFVHYRRAVGQFDGAHAADVTGVDAESIRAAAAMLAPDQAIAYHAWSGVGQHSNATQTERAIATLYALTGAFDRQGANREFVKQPANAVSDFGLLAPQQRAKALGLQARPLGPPAQGWVTARDVYQAIVAGKPYKVRGLLAFGTNFLSSQADADAAHEALCALDFHVHCDLFETPSARYADILLPINTPWEREGLRLGFEINERAVELVQLRQRMVSPRGESRADYDVVMGLATRLGMSAQFFDGSIEAGWNHMLAPLGLDVAQLRAHPEGIVRPLQQHERQYARTGADGIRGFRTETLRVELYSEKLLRHGYPPVPEYVPPQHGRQTTRKGAPAAKPAFPYVLTSVKHGLYCHSQHRSLASLRRRAPYPSADLSASLARERGIVEDDWIVIETTQGRARFRARISAELAHDVIVAEYGWWQACDEMGLPALPVRGAGNSNFNSLVSDATLDPLSGASPLRSLPCTVALDPSVDPARRAWQGWRDFMVSAIHDEALGVRTITLRAADGGPLPDYLPGQHITVHLPSLGDGGTTRAYSLVGPATVVDRRSYTISVRHQRGTAADGNTFEGVMSAHLHRALRAGDAISLRPPGGTFIVPPASPRPVVMFAGGIGITPFISYLETVHAADQPAPPSWLFYANQNSRTHAFRERIAALAAAMPALHVVNCYNQAEHELLGRDFELSGYLTADVVDAALIRRRARFYLCGPEPMMNAITEGLVARGVPPFDIFREAFRSPSKPRLDPTQRFVVSFARSKKQGEWSPDKGSLLSFAEDLGVRLPSGCRVGQCESCAVRVAAGKVEHMNGQPPEDADLCFACQAIPVSPVTIDA
ncbi:molybdopterin-dependent oxidoreductase [Chitinasiproducens palmae]|uniref:Anaerobic selenocysteine-containing dehydrogenase n=1 Tax=Chitinasiproducens palmae TaxID=1770053 RepID=A0A1H2PKE0_9BURK|nr:molybdopterin-dependent oxidoreductase [Chitinasiproducens palmae]SDV46908.1 Anaerobic selenocysteine-containing dehydrogenase [Chitinasiproducens palmae]